MTLTIGVPKESAPGEQRVALAPDAVAKLLKKGFKVLVEAGAGHAAHFDDATYKSAGAEIGASSDAWGADIVFKVQAPTDAEARRLKKGATLMSFIWPARNAALVEVLKNNGVTTLAMDAVPRISRAQKLDALSSMANIAGYRAVVEAAANFGGFFTGQITAAGKVPPAKVLVIGAGVAGLAAIGAARGLGAIVRAFDTRPEVKDQVKSMGAEFLELNFKEEGDGGGGYAKTMSPEFIKAEMELFAKQAKDVDIIITTALIPNKKAPILITTDMVKSMRQGSVVVDMAAEQGGNCELTTPGQSVVREGVTIIGYTDLPSRLPTTASRLYGNNLCHFIDDLTKSGAFAIDLNDEVVRGAIITHQGQMLWPAPRPTTAPAPAAKPAAVVPAAKPASKEKSGASQLVMALVLAAVAFGVGRYAPSSFLSHLTVFVLACFIGWQVVWNVNPALHTPLMSVTNAISGIIVIGAMLQVGGDMAAPATLLAALAILIATINVAGGFLVTHRMLGMFRKR
jgi:NAD(P) transhydrogenase subunit alpha